jgi:ArsR family transcriptional regulator, virulence genes transcriptional regulator
MAVKTSRTASALGAKMQEQAEQAVELLKALSNPQRLRVMCLLIDGERTVGEINAEIELSQSALSQHLAVLREGGWVQTRRESQNVYYSVVDGPVHQLIQTLHDIYCPTPGEAIDDEAG